MSTTYYGQPWRISQVPTPVAAVNISSSTNASPTVITTSTNHNLQSGMAVIVHGHLVNTNANGVWIVTVTGATTFKISTFSGYPAGLVNGNGVGGATGTVQGLQLPGADLPEDAVDTQDAASVNTPLEALLDMSAWLVYKAMAASTILPGGSITINGLLGGTTTGTLLITAEAGTNNSAIGAVGDGTGTGIIGSGGSGGNATGIQAVGGTTNGIGLDASGTGTGAGITAAGGTSGGDGIQCHGNAGGWAINVGAGNATFSGTAPTKTADPGSQALASSNVPKAWGNVSTDGLAGITYNDGHGITSVQLNVGGYIVVTFSRAFASTSYGPIAGPLVTGQRQWIDIISSTVCRVYTTDLADAPIDPSTTVVKFALHVFGRQ